MSSEMVLKRILVPLDGSDPSFQAARYAINIAKMVNAEIIFMHAVVNPPYVEYMSAGLATASYIEEAKRQANTWYADLSEKATQKGVKVSSETIVDIASVADSILNYAESKKVDLIVIGTHGRTGVKRFLLGSVASGVVAHAKCSVLVVR